MAKLSSAGSGVSAKTATTGDAPHRKLAEASPAETANWLPYPGNPAQKDWASVVSACRTLAIEEKRFCNFFIRAAFHDSLAIHPGAWATEPGADGSLFLNATEMARPENSNDDFALLSGRAAVRIARWYNVSVADTLAVCSASCTTVINGPDVIGTGRLKVGRMDNTAAAPPHQLLSPFANTTEFADFFTERGLEVDEGLALLGTHSLIDLQRCFRGITGPRDYCDPTKEACTDVRMFNFAGNRYFTDLCTPELSMVPDAALPPGEVATVADPFAFEGDMIRTLNPGEYEGIRMSEMCSWTSMEMRRSAMAFFADMRAGKIKGEAIVNADITPVWLSSATLCQDPSLPAVVRANCPHARSWMYTVNDAWLGSACQGKLEKSQLHATMQDTMLSYTNKANWRAAYSRAFVKMVNQGAKWAEGDGVRITGTECVSGFFNPTSPNMDCSGCESGANNACPYDCICRTAFRNGWAAKAGTDVLDVIRSQIRTGFSNPTVPQLVSSTLQALFHDPLANAPGVPLPDPDAGLIDPDIPDPSIPGATPGPGWDPLVSPYITSAADREAFCHPATDVIDPATAYKMGGFPSSPFKIIPFSRPFTNPVIAEPSGRACRSDGHCAIAYDMPTYAVSLDVFGDSVPGCNGVNTNFMAYNGSVPGPTIIAPVGHQVAVQFRNHIGAPWEVGHEPCNAEFGRPEGRPISIHLHGSASLAPWDGWADDETCSTEEKTYLYPNNRPTTGWYHDHGLHVTAENAYFGMAAFYLMSDHKKHGGCGGPWNMEDMEELHLMLADRVINSTCQTYIDNLRAHRNNIYGDITLVSGVPYPQMDLQPKWYRLRLLNTGITRPYLIKIKNATGHDVAHDICHMIASDGGYRETPHAFPVVGLLMGVAERYEAVCDFSRVPGQTLYLWNGRNRKMQKNVPYFCFTHLIARITVAEKLPDGVPAPPVFDPTIAPVGDAITPHRTFTEADYANALALARADQPHRRFKFGRRNGRWVVNGETWDTFKIAAMDVGQNTWELWELQSGGGWFHPIHVHLVDFFVLSRTNVNAPGVDLSPDGVFSYEQLAPKDVVYLGPSNKIMLVARFGPHRGDYMFHCHNLIHEDNDMLRGMHIVSNGKTTAGTALTIQTAASGLVLYDSYADPMFNGTAAKVPVTPNIIDDVFAAKQLDLNAYKIFYPLAGELPFDDLSLNPWKVQVCPLPAAKRPVAQNPAPGRG